MRVCNVLVAAVSALACNSAWSEIRLPKLVGDHMVLQRDAKVTVWGWADPREIVRVVFHGQTINARTDSSGRWSVSLGPFSAGGPYDMTIAGKNRILLQDILLGDVWLASGQSNMEFQVAAGGPDKMPGVIDADRELAEARFPNIRIFKVHRKIALTPRQDVEANAWTAVTPESVGGFSAVAYFFGRDLYLRYHAPIGLIDSSWGGTVAEAWVSEASLKQFPEFQGPIDSLRGIDESAAIAEYQQYQKAKAEWNDRHAGEDRGRSSGEDVWAAAELSTTGWPSVDAPQTKAIDDLMGFDGVVWFRKEIVVSPEHAGKDLTLHLAYPYKDDTTFFNGTKVAETAGGEKPNPRNYLIPGDLVMAGRNLIAVRVKGSDGFAGIYSDDSSKFEVDVDGQTISLAGQWKYQPGPDLSRLPTPSMYSKLSTEPNSPTLLFDGMIVPLTSYRIKGAIWYQGESNAKRSGQYRTLFPALIEDWRKHWGYQFPFLFVQLAGWPPPSDGPLPPDTSIFAELREAQSMALALPATGMASAVDQPDDHPKDKRTVGHRLALTAARLVYGDNVVASGPTYASMNVETDRIRIHFSNLGTGLVVRDKYGYVRGLQIAGSDGKFVWAKGRKDGQEIIVSGEGIPHPTAVRYDWTDTPDGNLFNEDGLPAVPFRTVAPTPKGAH